MEKVREVDIGRELGGGGARGIEMGMGREVEMERELAVGGEMKWEWERS